jgi:hypothetical protein
MADSLTIHTTVVQDLRPNIYLLPGFPAHGFPATCRAGLSEAIPADPYSGNNFSI